MTSHKNCTHPATTLARRECRKQNPSVDEPTPHVEVEDEAPRVELRTVKVGGKPLTREAYKAMRCVDARQVHKPLVRIPRRSDWDYDVIGRDEGGEYVRAYGFWWEERHDEFMALPARRLA